jgi:hypothetical protein
VNYLFFFFGGVGVAVLCTFFYFFGYLTRKEESVDAVNVLHWIKSARGTTLVNALGLSTHHDAEDLAERIMEFQHNTTLPPR